ncbi:MAG TPA: hypothetical protein VNP91_00560 [Methylomirabilota bacterium]|nr:hypothetical protein [Methylomirabilota bacterium]
MRESIAQSGNPSRAPCGTITSIVEGGRRLIGLVDLPAYRKTIEEI